MTAMFDLGDSLESGGKIVKLPFERMFGDRRQATTMRRSGAQW